MKLHEQFNGDNMFRYNKESTFYLLLKPLNYIAYVVTATVEYYSFIRSSTSTSEKMATTGWYTKLLVLTVLFGYYCQGIEMPGKPIIL